MPKKYTDEEYHKMLPKKQVGTAVLFFNQNRDLLILKPDYKDAWLVPGGSCDEGESPRECAIREVKEEIGLNVNDLELIGIYHSPRHGIYFDSLKFIFWGGILTEEQILNIKIQKDEIDLYDFKNPEIAIPMLSNSLQKSVPDCLKVIQAKGKVVFIDEKS